MQNDTPLAQLVAGNVLNLVAIHSNIESIDELNNITPDTILESIGIDDKIKKLIISQFEESLKEINISGKIYSIRINNNVDEISTIQDIIKAVLEAMSSIVKEVSN